jgi:hypothetical protein
VRFRAPGEQEAQERAWAIVRRAYEEREPVTWPRRHARPLVVGALVAAAVAAVLSPPGRSVVHSLRKAVGVENAQMELFSLPAPGRVLVSGAGGAWIVNADGSRRRLGGPYRNVTWSPHGRFIAATRKSELLALDPKGNVRWTLPRRSARLPTWTGTFTDTRIAYIAGRTSHEQLHVVAGDGTGDRAIGEARPATPAWRPGPGHVLAYISGPPERFRLVILDVDSGRTLLRLRPPVGAWRLAWSSDGRRLLAVGATSLRIYTARGKVALAREPSGGNHYVDGGFVPGTHRVLVLSEYGFQSAVVAPATGRVLFRGSGTFGDYLAFSPDGRWALVSWPTANQWVFLRISGPRHIVGVSRISTQFGGFPRVEGWCCGG